MKKDIYDYYLKFDPRTIRILKQGIKEYEITEKLFGKHESEIIIFNKSKEKKHVRKQKTN